MENLLGGLEGDVAKNNPIRMKATKESFLLLNPNLKKNSHEVAREMATCMGVKKVFITSGEFGFVVHAKHNSDHSAVILTRAVGRASGRAKAIILQSHFVYAGAPAKAK